MKRKELQAVVNRYVSRCRELVPPVQIAAKGHRWTDSMWWARQQPRVYHIVAREAAIKLDDASIKSVHAILARLLHGESKNMYNTVQHILASSACKDNDVCRMLLN